MFHGQPVAWVLGETLEAARRGAARVQVEYEPLPAILTIEQAIAADSFLTEPLRLARGDMSALASSAAPLRRRAGDRRPGALLPRDAGGDRVARRERRRRGALVDAASRPRRRRSWRACSGLPRHQVTVECLRMGGAFGGKEVQANAWAAVAALGAWKTRRPVRVRLTRAARHGADRQAPSVPGALRGGLRRRRAPRGAAAARSISDGGWSLDLSEPIMWRALFHCDNAYSPARRRGRPAASAARTRRRRPRSAASADRRACS